MCIPRVTPSAGSFLLSKLTSKLKHAPNTNSLVLANKGPQPRQFATMKGSSRVEPELKAAGSLSNSLNCPAITYISIMTVFTSLVIMNNLHGTQYHKVPK